MRLLLFDVDGTLVRGSPAKSAFGHALAGVFGTAGPIADHDFAGKTDPRIARELLHAAGLTNDEIDAGLPRFWDRYLSELARRIPSDPARPLPGVAELVPLLAARQDVALGLVTGNLKGGARLKLASAGLWERFPVGAFGSDRAERNELPEIAVRRASARWGRSFEGDVVVIGDTPRDVACGRAAGAATVAVATGRFTAAELKAAAPDLLLPGFGDATGTAAALTGRLIGSPVPAHLAMAAHRASAKA